MGRGALRETRRGDNLAGHFAAATGHRAGTRAKGARARPNRAGQHEGLSRFADASFDVVWHSHSLVFVDDAARVLREVGRVLAPGGTYVMSTVHPTTMRLYGTFAGGGWRPSVSYFADAPIPQSGKGAGVWEFGRKRVYAPTIEYAHRFETIINGIAAGGMLVDGLWEMRPQDLEPPRRRPRDPPPGSDDHLHTLFPAYVQVRARRSQMHLKVCDGTPPCQPLAGRLLSRLRQSKGRESGHRLALDGRGSERNHSAMGGRRDPPIPGKGASSQTLGCIQDRAAR